MRIACPVCSANYEVPDRMLGPGRKVRCGNCGHQWAPGAAPVRDAVPPPRPAPAQNPELPVRASLRDRLAELPRAPAQPQPLVLDAEDDITATPLEDDAESRAGRQAGGSTAWLGWVASVAIWALVIWAAYAYRFEVMNAWPPSQRLYAALGLGPGS